MAYYPSCLVHAWLLNLMQSLMVGRKKAGISGSHEKKARRKEKKIFLMQENEQRRFSFIFVLIAWNNLIQLFLQVRDRIHKMFP